MISRHRDVVRHLANFRRVVDQMVLRAALKIVRQRPRRERLGG